VGLHTRYGAHPSARVLAQPDRDLFLHHPTESALAQQLHVRHRRRLHRIAPGSTTITPSATTAPPNAARLTPEEPLTPEELTVSIGHHSASTTGPVFLNRISWPHAATCDVDGHGPAARLPTFCQQLRRRCIQTAFASSDPSSDRAWRSVSSSRPRVGPMLPIGTARRALISA